MTKYSGKMENDSALLKQLKSGNIDLEKLAFEKIYKSYYKLIYFYVGGLIEDVEDVRDLVQDIFLELFVRRYDVTNIKYYLLSLAKYKIYHLKNDKKMDIRLVDIMELDIEVDSIKKDSIIYKNIMGAIDRVLSKEDSELVLNHVLYDIPLKVLARKYNMTYTYVRTRYRRAIKRLKKEVQKNEED